MHVAHRTRLAHSEHHTEKALHHSCRRLSILLASSQKAADGYQPGGAVRCPTAPQICNERELSQSTAPLAGVLAPNGCWQRSTGKGEEGQSRHTLHHSCCAYHHIHCVFTVCAANCSSVQSTSTAWSTEWCRGDRRCLPTCVVTPLSYCHISMQSHLGSSAHPAQSLRVMVRCTRQSRAEGRAGSWYRLHPARGCTLRSV